MNKAEFESLEFSTIRVAILTSFCSIQFVEWYAKFLLESDPAQNKSSGSSTWV